MSIFVAGYFVFVKKQLENTTAKIQPANTDNQESNGLKTFTFDNFHGSSDISDKFKFQYPVNWYNEGQYFSPQKIRYYDMNSVNAPIYYDLISADIFDTSDLKYQINNDNRNQPDSTVKIDGKDFKKYDLIDYGGYGGDSAGRVIIFLSRSISVNSEQYYLVFHWEEKPLSNTMLGNDPKIFEEMILTLKFVNF